MSPENSVTHPDYNTHTGGDGVVVLCLPVPDREMKVLAHIGSLRYTLAMVDLRVLRAQTPVPLFPELLSAQNPWSRSTCPTFPVNNSAPTRPSCARLKIAGLFSRREREESGDNDREGKRKREGTRSNQRERDKECGCEACQKEQTKEGAHTMFIQKVGERGTKAKMGNRQ
ncbi:hypothetical protein IRJ41_012544 [Triplophysa rosa]|uniref:Uncharacterized protein n=1 Tax=Triplophysa rosa TaxID=992332 RepID=A0A9W7TFZ6_TRIRA|nr:hypothetical protein IRJ41_012544 [Triplophysa rosa]